MLNKLRNKLVIINISIISLLFTILILGGYFFAKNDALRKAEFMTKEISGEIIKGKNPDEHMKPPQQMGPPPGDPIFNPHPPNLSFAKTPPPKNFFLKTNSNNNIFYTSTFSPYDPIIAEKLVNEVFLEKKQSGIICFQDNDFWFYITPLPENPGGNLIVFHDLTPEMNILQTIVVFLSLIGIFCMFISLLASLYLANKAMAPIRKSWQQQKDFIADASHELRTPLSVINTNIAVIKSNSNELVSSQLKWLNNIDEVTNQMSKLVNSLLFIARSDTNKQAHKEISFSFETLITHALRPFRPVASKKGILLSFISAEDVKITGDPDKLKQMLTIFIDNALNFTPALSCITINLSKANGYAVVSITDMGDGISPEHLPRIFDRFYQADKSRSGSSSGLGLSIAKLIIEQHNGTVEVESTLGKGTTFTIKMPINKPDNKK